jgi:hypothetical protein
MGFLYYIPGGAAGLSTPEAFDLLMEKIGLGGVWGGVGHWANRQVENNGPDGGAGLIVAPYPRGQESGRVGFYPAEQKWFKRSEKGEVRSVKWEVGSGKEEKNYWLGYFNESRPGPGDLLREGRGIWRTWGVRLRDGNEWEIPIAHALPTHRYLGTDGEVKRERLPEFRAYREQLERFLAAYENAVNGDGTILFDEDELYSLAGEALGLVYHVGLGEVLSLDLLTDNLAFEIAQAGLGIQEAVENRRVMELEKKTE